MVFHEAHVEAVGTGLHRIVINDGPNYRIVHVHPPKGKVLDGPQTVPVRISNLRKDRTIWIDVEIEFD